MINQLLSTDTIWKGIIKTDLVIRDFKEFLEEYMDNPGGFVDDINSAVFHLVESYDDNFSKLKGKDLMLADCLKHLGCPYYSISKVSPNDDFESVMEIGVLS